MKTTTLYRPVGQKEFDLIVGSGHRAFPPRLPEQPIFYPVLNHGYAEQIARDWNTRDENSGFAGFVMEFDVDADYLKAFDVRKVGGKAHLEYWIPSEQLEEFKPAYRWDDSVRWGLSFRRLKAALKCRCLSFVPCGDSINSSSCPPTFRETSSAPGLRHLARFWHVPPVPSRPLI